MADDFSVGQVFSSFDEFYQAFNLFNSRTNCIFVKRQTQTIDSYNKGMKEEESKWPTSWKYRRVSFMCKHFGQPRPNPCAKSSTNSFKTGCEASITLQANKSKNGLVVTRSHLDHSNHPLLAGLRVYPENRKITSDDEKEIEKLHTLGVSCQRIREHLEATSGADLESYDVRNKIQKMVAEKEAGKSAEDLIISEFKAMKERDPHSSWDVCKSEDGVAEVITFQTSHMKQLFAKYPEAIFLDATYKTNNRHMPLFTFMVADGDNKGHAIFYALVMNEQYSTLMQMLNSFVSANPKSSSIKTFVVDKDFVEINSVKTTFPNAAIVLCKFHVLQAIQRSLRSYSNDASEDIKIIISAMLACSTEEAYEALHDRLQSNHEQYYHYFTQNWHRCKEQWVGCYVRNQITFGNTTNNFVESHNQKIKQRLHHTLPIHKAVIILLNMHSKSVKDIVFGQQKALLKKPVIRTTFENVKEVLVNVYSTVVPKAAKKVQAELEASMGQIFLIDEYGSTIDPNGKKYTTTSTSCTCFTSQSQLLPCRHIFYIRNSKEEVLFRVEDFPKHYLLNTFLEDLSISSSTLPLSNSGVHQMPSVTKPVKMNENEKYRLAFSTVKDICSIMASFDDKKFHHYMANLKNMSELMKEGKHIDMIVEYDGERTLVVDEDFNSSGLPVVTPSVTNEEESLIVNDGIEGTSIFSTRAVSNTEMLPSTSGVPASVTVDEGESSNDSDNSIFYLPTAIKRKGRPKGLSTKKKVRRTCSSAFDAEKVLSELIPQSLVPMVLNHSLKIDESMIYDIDLISPSVVDIKESLISHYFTHSGWGCFIRVLESLRLAKTG